MSREEIATTYEEYKNGAKQVSGLGRLSCYQGLDYLEKLLEKDKFYSEQLEDTIVFIESHINRIEKENEILRENAENNDKVVDKVNWENMLLKKENKQLKDKLSKIETLIINHNCDTGDIYYKYNSKFLKSELKQRILEILYGCQNEYFRTIKE